MPTHVAAMGKAGARAAEALIWAAMAGNVQNDLRVVLIGADKNAADRVISLAKDHAQVRARMQAEGVPGFTVRIEMLTWPGEMQERSLNDQAETEAEKLLCAALFTREQASLSPVHALDASGPVAAMTWAGLLSQQDCAALMPMRGDCERVILLGSLCEAVCAAGIRALPAWLGKRCDAVLLLACRQGEDTALCRAALEAEDTRAMLNAAVLLGLPEDCRNSEDSGCSLCEWLAAESVRRLQEGLEGTHVWQVPCDAESWRKAGDAFDFMTGHDRLTRACCMLAAVYGPQLMEALRSPKWLRDRLTAWYSAHFSAVRTMEDAQRLALLDDVLALQRLMRRYAAWMQEVQASLPAVIKWHAALQDTQSEAASHYAYVLDTAGQIAWLQFEADRSGMAGERFVHRHDMSDSEAEATIRQIGDLKEKLVEQLDEQRDLDKKAGGRMTRAMLRALLTGAEKEAAELLEQAQEGRRRVARAAEIATVEDMPKVDAARVRLDRMERHAALLDGRAQRIREDLAYYGEERQIMLQPELTEQDAAPGYLVPPELLDAAQLLMQEDADVKKLGQRLFALWPWKDKPVRGISDAVARKSGGSDCLGGFMNALLRACGKEALG